MRRYINPRLPYLTLPNGSPPWIRQSGSATLGPLPLIRHSRLDLSASVASFTFY